MTRSVRGGDEVCEVWDSRHCAAWEGKVTLAFVGALVSAGPLTASLRRFMRLVLALSCPPFAPRPDIDIAVDNEPYVWLALDQCARDVETTLDLWYPELAGGPFSS